MKLSKHRRDHVLVFNMTPMIDIVFLLLIFFMTVSQISQVNRQFLQLPTVGQVKTESRQVSITISITQNQTCLREGQIQTWDQLATSLRQDLAAAGGDPQRISLMIRCDRRCPSSQVNQLLVLCRQLGITFVRTAVME